ncbi:TniQ family protein [Methylobacillus flagellatus]|uniref:TniQ family protein n=1 Tax=Methylobacillus flagellatus TaxID=405 RepID=UPI0028539976|nr:TniQ family protein [Methylobacillus flagellatus]MDR5171929.1 TniQ family protein [Methylobacillus flagellatus]
MKTLVVTPRPFPYESFPGYLLRLSESNGYTKPSLILTYAGIDNDHFTINPSVYSSLSKVLGFNLADYFSSSDHNKYASLAQDIEISDVYMGSNSPRLCPICIQQNGYHHNFFDTKYAIGCPDHALSFKRQCPTCDRKLKWNRPGLLKCNCGHTLEHINRELPADLTQVLHLIKWRLYKDEQSLTKISASGYPLEHLLNLDLNAFLSIFRRLEIRPQLHIQNSSYSTARERSLEAAHALLHNWPNGFWDYLENHAVEPDSSLNITTQFRTFYYAFCLAGQRNKPIAFLHKSFIDFGNQRWKKSTLDKRSLKRADLIPNIMGINALADYLKVTKPTVMQYMKDGVISGKKIKAGASVRYIFDVSSLPFLPSEGESLDQRHAAAWLKISVNLLKALKAERVLILDRLAVGTHGYNLLSLQGFLDRVISTVVKSRRNNNGAAVTLQDILQKKHIQHTAIAKLIGLTLNGEIIPVAGTNLPSLTFLIDDLQKLQLRHNLNFLTGKIHLETSKSLF